MRKDKNTSHFSANEMREKRSESLTNWHKVDAITDKELDEAIADDEEQDFVPDWTKATLVVPPTKQSVNLRLEREIIDYFKAQGRGHISKMQAVLKAYVNAHQNK